MGPSSLRRVLEPVQERLHRAFGVDYRTPFADAIARHWRVIAGAAAGLVLIAVVGYAIGSSRVSDAATAREAGITAGERRGEKSGANQGYERAFKPARERSYRLAYRRAYRAAYASAMEDAGLSAPRLIKVTAP